VRHKEGRVGIYQVIYAELAVVASYETVYAGQRRLK
jgi:hypothetical protein